MHNDLTIVAEAIPGLILQINEDGVFVEIIANDADRLFKEELIGKSIHETMSPLSDLFFSLITKTIQTNTPQNIEYEVSALSGEIFYYEGRCVPMKHETQGKKCVIFIRKDITRRKRIEDALTLSEERFRSIYENTNSGIAFADKYGSFLSINAAFSTILEYSKEELILKRFNEFTHPEDIEMEMDLLKEIIQGKRDKFQIEKRCITGTGKVIWIDLNLAVIRHVSDQSPIHFITVITDISERKTTEKLLKELNQTKDKFFSIIAHDLQSPLSGIIGLCDILKNNFDRMNDSQRASAIHSLLEGSHNANALLKNLLEWSQSQSGKIAYKPEASNLKKVLENTRALYENQALQKSITIVNHISELDFVFSDVYILNTIFRNLINNAIKYTNTGGLISIDASKHADDYIVSIKDNGVGMSESLLNQLFLIETKVTTPGTAKEKGTGLGLILCKEFVEKYCGRIWVNSMPGEGSTFYFTVPALKESVEIAG